MDKAKPMSNYIKNLILQGEHQQLDFKFQVNDSRKIARTLGAFSNTDGGKLLIGVKDNGSIAGIRTDEEYHMIEAAAQMYCKPEIDFAFRNWTIDGRKVLEIDVPRAQAKPVFACSDDNRWLAWVRVGDQNILADPIMNKFWKRRKSPKGTFIQYSDKEKLLLEYLNAHPVITLKQYATMADLPNADAEDVIVNFLTTGLIDINQNEHHTWFRLKDPGR